MSIRGLAWTQILDDQLMQLVDRGLTLRQISDEMRLPTWYVHKRVRDLGLEIGPSKLDSDRQSARMYQATERWLDHLDMIEPAFYEAITRITSPATYYQLSSRSDEWVKYTQDTPTARDIRDLAQATAALTKTALDGYERLMGRAGQAAGESLIDQLVSRLRGKREQQSDG